ncbi:MAG: hypothetical protein K8S99_00950 [Planctomycetes bacterium]|nr:hypothetical protein [Planctomycetota bacterium]
MKQTHTTRSLFVAALLAAAALATPLRAEPPATQPAGEPKLVAMKFDRVIQKGDHVLFVGDEVTQQMYYTRAVAAAIISMRPDDNLRFYNGGYDGATAESAIKWIDDLMGLAKPTVVFISFGLNELGTPGTDEDRAVRYEKSLASLVERIQKFPTVKRVIVMSPAPVLRPDDTEKNLSPENTTLLALSHAAGRVAVARGAAYIDLVEFPREVFVKSTMSPGPPLAINNRLPSEIGHIVIASVILHGIGVTPEMLDPKGWAPLAPRQMHRIRQALALNFKPTSLGANDVSRDLYGSFRVFDERFFKLWRLSGRNPAVPPRDALLPQVEEAWADVRAATLNYKD